MAATVCPPPKFVGLDNSGNPLSSGKLYSYLAGTSTPAATYSDSTLATPNANPTILDAGGRASVYLSATSYKFILTSSSDVTIYTQDNVISSAPYNVDLDVPITAGETLTSGQAIYLSDGTGARTAGRWYLTDSDTAAYSTLPITGFVTTDVASGATGSVRLLGEATVPGALSVGSTYYLSGTPGALSTSAGTFAKAMGVADSATTLIMTVQQTVSSTGNLLVSGTLTVTGATALQSTLAVTGATTLSSTLAVTGATTLTGGLNTPLVPAQGGTGLSSYAVGDLVYASGSTTLAKLADVAVGQVLVSGGVTTAPAYSASPSITALTYTTNLKSTTALATPGALSATQATEFASTVSGAALMGFGTTNDVSLMNRAGTVVLGVGPNTTLVDIPAALTVGTTLGVTGVTTVAAGSAAAPALVSTTGTSDTGLWFPAADTVAASTAGSERLRIDASGNLLVGQTTADAHLVVTDAANSGWGVRVLKSSGGGTPQGLQVVVGQNSSNEVLQLAVGTSFASVTNLFKVQGNGEINTGTAASSPYTNTTGSAANMFVASTGVLQRSTSSRKYKTQIHDAIHGLSELLRLRPVTYCGINDGDTVFGGLIAEEVDAIGLREFVCYNTLHEPDALAYGNMVSLAIKAIQEQQALITALTARVTSLEGVAR